MGAPHTWKVASCAAGVLGLLLPLLLEAAMPAALAQGTTLSFGLPIPLDSPVGKNIHEFARQAEARTGGALKIELQGKDRGYDERGVVSVVASGAIDMGATTLSQFGEDVPVAGVFLQPFLFNFDALVQAATGRDSEIRTLIETELLEQTGIRVLWWLPYGSSVILSRKQPVTDPAAMAGRVVGTPDKETRELVTVCGGAPAPVSPASLLTELKSGVTIEAAAADIMHVRERELWRVADTITDLRHAPSLFVVVINERAWERLPPQQRDILAELAESAQTRMWQQFAAVKAQAYEFAAEKGMRIVALSADDVSEWRACSAPLLVEYMERAGGAGPKLFRAYGKLRASPCCREAPQETLGNRR